jgi:transposase-like protein
VSAGQILGVAEGRKDDLYAWRAFLRHLKDRGLAGVQLIISDACLGLVEAAAELFPEAQWHRCVVHFCRNVFSHAPKGKVEDVARMLKAIHAQEDRRSALDKIREVMGKLRAMRSTKVAERVEAKAHRPHQPALRRISRAAPGRARGAGMAEPRSAALCAGDGLRGAADRHRADRAIRS